VLVLLAPHHPKVWDAVAAELAGRLSLMAPDLRPLGSFDDMAARVLAEAPPRFAIAGLCMGGYLAFEILRRAGGRVAGLTLINTSARADDPRQALVRRRRMAALAGKPDGAGAAAYVEEALPWMLAPVHRRDPAIAAAAAGAIASIPPTVALRQQAAMLRRPDSRADLGRLHPGTLVIGGRQDRICPPELSVEIARLAPGARLEILDPCGHLAPLEQPERVARLILEWSGAAPGRARQAAIATSP
jgi:pimeloyl-ACP methyl ester carboxylesterase